MEFEYITKTHLVLDVNPQQTASKVVECSVNFEAEPFIQHQWRGQDALPNAQGVKAMTQGLVQGLVANILSSHERGLWDSAEHLRYVIKHLEEGFVRQAKITETTFPNSLKRIQP